jgi:hypothetical protein
MDVGDVTAVRDAELYESVGNLAGREIGLCESEVHDEWMAER